MLMRGKVAMFRIWRFGNLKKILKHFPIRRRCAPFLLCVFALATFVLAGCSALQAEDIALGTAAAETLVAHMTQSVRMTSVAGTLAPIPITGATETPVPTEVPTTTSEPVSTSTPLPSATPIPTAVSCQDEASLVRHVTIEEYEDLRPGAEFEKVWRVRNEGTCTWGSGYAIVFSGGDQMGGPDRKALGESVEPGDTVDIEINMESPSAVGAYRGDWLLESPSGSAFGVGDDDQVPLQVAIIVGPSDMTAEGGWQGEYFDNGSLNGRPRLKRIDAVIDFKWLLRAPASGFPPDQFSIRWTGEPRFEQGSYRFRLRADDSVRLWVDDELLIDSWGQNDVRWEGATIALAKARHEIRLEYRDRLGTSRVRLDWREVEDPTFDDWKGEYYGNIRLRGDPLLVRNDTEVDFDWGTSPPAVGVPKDDFSVRWEQTIDFSAGTYIFKARADGGIRVFVDDDLVLDEWHRSAGETVYEESVVLSGAHEIVVEYFDRGRDALARFWWESAP